MNAITLLLAAVTLVFEPGTEARNRRAADELSRHLKMLARAEGTFCLGMCAPGGVPAGAHEARYRVEGGRVYLWGDSRGRVVEGGKTVEDDYDGTLTAVYLYLQRELGFVWAWPGESGIVAPRNAAAVAKEGAEGVYVPPYDIGRLRSASARDLISFHLPFLDGRPVRVPKALSYDRDSAARLCNDVGEFYRRNRNHSKHVFRYGHAFLDWYDRFAKTHPEYLALDEAGNRGNAENPSRTMLCVSNEGVVDQILADWRAAGRPKYLNACENDGGGLCRCADCRALDCDLPGEDFHAHKTDRYLNFWNRIAAKAVRERPDVQVTGYIYAFYRHHPRRERIEYPDNMTFGTVPSLADDWLDFYEGWRKAGLKRYFLRPNFHSSTASLPRGAEKLIYDVFCYCRDHGMIGADFDTYPGRFPTALENYVAVRLVAEPALSFERIVDDYCSAYGEAADDVRAYYARIRARRTAADAATRAALKSANLLDDSQTSVRQMDPHTEAALREDAKLLIAARDRVRDPMARRRLEALIVQAREYVLVYRFFDADRSGDRARLAQEGRRLIDYRLSHPVELADHYSMTMNSRVRGTEGHLWRKIPEVLEAAQTVETAKWQAEIDRVSAAGGGRVVVPAGRHVVGSLFLKGGVTLELAKGCRLAGSPDIADYAGIDVKYWEGTGPQHALILSGGQADVAICGEGEIYGSGGGFYDEPRRPKGLLFYRCRNVRVEGVTLRCGGSWTLNPLRCDGVVIRNVKIWSHVNHCEDGIDISSKNVLIEGCDVDAGDDAYCLKSNDARFTVENVLVRNCMARSHCNAFKLGTSTHGVMRNIRFENCRSEASKRVNNDVGPMPRDLTQWKPIPGAEWYLCGPGFGGINVECVDGGLVENVTFDNIEVYGFMMPIFVRGGDRGGRQAGFPHLEEYAMRDIVIQNVRGQAEASAPSTVTGTNRCRPKNVTLRNIDIACYGDSGKDPRKTSVPGEEISKAYPQPNMFDKYRLPAYGLFADKVDGLTCENVRFTLRPGTTDGRPATYGL